MSSIKPKRKFSIAKIVLSILIGVTALLSSVGGFSHVIEEADYSSTTGKIVALDLQTNGNKVRTKNRCSPIVEFNVNEKIYASGPDQYASYHKNGECEFAVGDEMEVRYDPSNPTNSTVANSTFDWLLGLISGAVAVVFGVILPFRMIRRSRDKVVD